MNPPLAKLSQRIGHEFGNPQLLRSALTHRSAGGHHNERLEFLGDALLDFVIAEELYRSRPDAPEGDLSRLRAHLVKRSTLAEISSGLGVGDFLFMGGGELKSGGFRRSSILADALEALLGAVYLDAGFNAAESCVRRLFAERVSALPEAAELRDPKTRLQELLQARGRERPEYRVVAEEGEAHKRTFRVECTVGELGITVQGSGSSRRRAEQEAAKKALLEIEDE